MQSLWPFSHLDTEGPSVSCLFSFWWLSSHFWAWELLWDYTCFLCLYLHCFYQNIIMTLSLLWQSTKMTQDYLVNLITLAVLYLKRSSFPNRVMVVVQRLWISALFSFSFMQGKTFQNTFSVLTYISHGEFTHLILASTKISTHYRLAHFNFSCKYQKLKFLKYH